MEYTALTYDEVDAQEGLGDWRILLGKIWAEFHAKSFSDAAALANSIAELSDRVDHHPTIDIRYPGQVIVSLSTHATDSLTTLDVDVARQISKLAADANTTAETASVQQTEIALDVMDAEAVRPFWAAVFGYREDSTGDLVDPKGVGPALWFQQMDEARTERSRFHMDVTVTHDVAEERVAKVIAAGGRLLSDERAKAFWVLADAEGNEACICTWQDRSHL